MNTQRSCPSALRRAPTPSLPQAAAWLLALMVCLAPAAATAAVAAAPEVAAWKKEVVYQIFPASFADSNDDGVGDLRGIIGKVDYLHRLGVNVVWLNPIFKSPHVDSGYDVTDYLDIDPMYGSLADWYDLRDALHSRGMKMMLDLVMNHTADDHPWFVQEKRLKGLQHALTALMRQADADTRGQILQVLQHRLQPTPQDAVAVRAAAAALGSFDRADDSAAMLAGYPDHQQQLATLEQLLTPCMLEPRSCPSIEQPEHDFYHWRAVPNNWTGIFSGSAWHYVDAVDAYFLSLFSIRQIDLNWRNPQVRQAMANVVDIWQQRGLDGMRLDSAGTIAKDPGFPNGRPGRLKTDGVGSEHFRNLPLAHAYVRELNRHFGPNFRSVGEVGGDIGQVALDYAGTDRHECREVILLDHTGVDFDGNKWHTKRFELPILKQRLDFQQKLAHGRAWLANYLENHDQLRVVSRWGDIKNYHDASAKVFATLLMTLEGSPYIYQGQEIGMTDLREDTFKSITEVDDIEGRIFYDEAVRFGADPKVMLHEIVTRSRDNVRSVMQWDSSPYAGFSHAPPKVDVNDNFASINVAQSQARPDSVLNYYRKLIDLHRDQASWLSGSFTDHLPADPTVYVYSRDLDDERSLVVLNFSSAARDLALPVAAQLGSNHRLLVGNYEAVEPMGATLHLRPWEARVYLAKGRLRQVASVKR